MESLLASLDILWSSRTPGVSCGCKPSAPGPGSASTRWVTVGTLNASRLILRHICSLGRSSHGLQSRHTMDTAISGWKHLASPEDLLHDLREVSQGLRPIAHER